jgi:hypothetical protein
VTQINCAPSSTRAKSKKKKELASSTKQSPNFLPIPAIKIFYHTLVRTMFTALQRTALRRQTAIASSSSLFTPLSVRLASTTQAPSVSKLYDSASEAVKDIKSGSIVLSSGFGLCGTPETLIKAISENKDIQNLTCVSNNAGVGEKGLGE